MEDPPKKFFRLAPGREVRLRYAYYITCAGVVKDKQTGEVIELHCTYDPETRGGSSPDGRKVKATLHWASAPHSHDAEVRLYDNLFSVLEPGENFIDHLNPDSLRTLTSCRIEPVLAGVLNDEKEKYKNEGLRYHYGFQLERLGYFCIDPKDSSDNMPVLNRTVTLKDTWAKVQKSQPK
jgi:glutaminyl-tRNA synthetase